MRREINVRKLTNKISQFRQNAIDERRIQLKELNKMLGCSCKIKESEQYWSGYLDALRNIFQTIEVEAKK